MKKQAIFLVIVLTTALAVAQPAQAPGPAVGPDPQWQGPRGGYGPGPGWQAGPMWGPQGRGWQGPGWQGPGPGPQRFGRRMGPGMMGPGMGPGRGQGFGPGFGPGRGRLQGPRPGFGGPGMFEQLGLTDDQRTKVRQQALEHRKANEKFGSDLRIKRWELQELLGAATQDRPKIDAKLKELSDLRLARDKARLDQRDAMLKILTPEQRDKMKQLGPGPGARRGFGPRGRADM
jgi:Spy/CpxP family protein refolding chaperone